MQTPLQEFEQRITGADGERYSVHLYGRSRPADTWQGWLVFVRQRDNRRFATPVETTQPNAEAIVYWSSGLTDVYFEGALQRAMAPETVIPQPPAPLTNIEQGVLAIFQRLRQVFRRRDHFERELSHLPQPLFPIAQIRAMLAIEAVHVAFPRLPEQHIGRIARRLPTDAHPLLTRYLRELGEAR